MLGCWNRLVVVRDYRKLVVANLRLSYRIKLQGNILTERYLGGFQPIRKPDRVKKYLIPNIRINTREIIFKIIYI